MTSPESINDVKKTTKSRTSHHKHHPNHSTKKVSKKNTSQIDNQNVRCTEITCVYTSTDQLTKSHSTRMISEFDSKCNPSGGCDWKKIVNADLCIDRDILLEVDTGSPIPSDLKDVQAVELVIAVQSAIKQRQQLIEEWKTKTVTLTDQVEKLQKERYSLEKANLNKDSELEIMAKKLNELQKHYKILSSESNKLKQELDCLRCDYQTLLDSYNSAVYDLKETKRRLEDAVNVENNLQQRLHEQTGRADCKASSVKQIEMELEDSRRQIQKLTCSLEETTKELTTIKETFDEYHQIHYKLTDLKEHYKNLKGTCDELEKTLNVELKENSSLKETVSKFNLTIEMLNLDKNELVMAVQCLNNEKNGFVERNAKLVRDLNHTKQNFFNAQRELKDLQSDVNGLKNKIQTLESCNATLCEELDKVKQDNNTISVNLQKTIGECTTLSRALSESQSQLESQQKLLTQVESKVRRLMNEKQTLENMISEQREEYAKSEQEFGVINCENANLKNANAELNNKLNVVTIELNDSLKEITTLNCEIEQLRQAIIGERVRHDTYISKLQEKIRKKSQEWKEYVTGEIERIRNKRRSDINKYLELNKDLEQRLNSCQESKTLVEEQLNLNIIDLTTKLDICKRKLDETIYKAKQEQAELLDAINSDNSKLKEKLNKQRLESQWLTTELDGKMQELIQKNLDDEASIKLLVAENETIKLKLKEVQYENCNLNQFKHDLHNLLDTQQFLEVELSNCKNLLGLAEECVLNLKSENSQIKKRLKSEEESATIVQNKILKLKKVVGKKDAQIEVLQHTITQLKDQVNHTNEENSKLKCSISDLETKHVYLTEKIRDLNEELMNARKQIESSTDDRKNLLLAVKKIEKDIRHLESENVCLKCELQAAKESQYMSEKALDHSHMIQTELKERMAKVESNANKSIHDSKYIEKKMDKMKEYISKLEHDIKSLNESHQYKDAQYKSKVEDLHCQLNTANEEICILKCELEKSEKQIHILRKSLKESEQSFHKLANIFDRLREMVCQVLSVPYVPVSLSKHDDSHQDITSRHKHYTEIINMYRIEVDGYVRGLNELKKNETELGCKLINTKKDFEKLSNVMKELQSDYTQKVEKLYTVVKEKEVMIKCLERQVVKAQLEAADADDNLSQSLKTKIEEQQNQIKRLHVEKSNLQGEILSLAKRINEMEGSIFELVERMKIFENKNSKLEIKNVSLEGDLEKLTLLLKEARDKEQDQLCQFKQMMLANRELMEKVRNLKSELSLETRELDDLRQKAPNYQVEDKNFCYPCKQSFSEKELELEVKLLTDKLSQSQRAELQAKTAMLELDQNIGHMKKQLSLAMSEKANLEGWVSHLQQLISGGYIADSTLPKQLAKVEEEKCDLQNTMNSIKQNMSTLTEDKRHLRQTVENLTKCNQNLEHTILAISKNKETLERELGNIQKKFDSLCQGIRSNDCDVSEFTNDINCLLKKAYSMTKSIKCPKSNDESECERRITAGIKSLSYPPKISSEESLESISVTVGCKSTTRITESTRKCGKKENDYETESLSPLSSTACFKCNYIEMKPNNLSDICKSVYTKSMTPHSTNVTSRTRSHKKEEEKSTTFV